MIRIALVASNATSLLTFRRSLIVDLIANGCNVVTVAPSYGPGEIEALVRIGADPFEVEMSRAGLNPWDDVRTFRALKRVFKETKPDVVIPYTIKPVIWGSLAARTLKIKRIVPMITGLGYAFADGREPRRLLSWAAAVLLYRIALHGADIVLFQNPDDMALFRRIYVLPTQVPSAVVNGSGIDLVQFASAPLPDSPAFLMIARLLGDKGVREFGEAARIVKARYPGVPIRLVGYLDQTPASIRQKELDGIVASGVEFLGRLADVRPAISQSSVYVLPSYYREGTPRSVLEAMAMGRAIITTDTPGCRETVVEGENGFLVPPRNSVALAEAMERFIENPALIEEMGRRSRLIAEAKYDVKLVNEDIMRHAGVIDNHGVTAGRIKE